MAVSNGIEHQHDVGDAVEARVAHGVWIPAVVQKLEPYRGRPGYYVSYPGATLSWECHGGWQMESCLRRQGEEKTP